MPVDALHLLPGKGESVGAALTSDLRVSGVCFTGGTSTARMINRAIADRDGPIIPLIAETGGLNGLFVDTTALREQVIDDIIVSAFGSAGQRCSALRVAFLPKSTAKGLIEGIIGAMNELKLGDPAEADTDVGPVIDAEAREILEKHLEVMSKEAKVLHQVDAGKIGERGFGFGPALVELTSLDQITEEKFGPILHIIRYDPDDIDKVVDAVNAKGYGLTFGIHSRVDRRIEHIASRIKVGNTYVNRNQIGAIVGSQPFGGEGLSGTGPKAGGPQYVRRFIKGEVVEKPAVEGKGINAGKAQKLIDQVSRIDAPIAEGRQEMLKVFFNYVPIALDLGHEEMPGPTGEQNHLSCHARGVVLCLGPDVESAVEQASTALSQGNKVVVVAPGAEKALADAIKAGLPVVACDGVLEPEALATLKGFEAVVSVAEKPLLKQYRQALLKRDGALLPIINEHKLDQRYVIERHLCIDTTAAGGNASLIASSE